MSTEIELKFEVPNPAAAQRIRGLRELGSYALGEPQEQRVHDEYLDTEGRSLLSAGWACRLRRAGEGRLVTLKSVRSARQDLHEREELEVMLEGNDPAAGRAPFRWPPSAARDKMLALAGESRLRVLATMDQYRTARMVLDGDRRVAAASLDKVTLQAHPAPRQWWELEVELADRGTELDLAAMSAWIRSVLGLRPLTQSKLERALHAPPKFS